MTTVNAAAAAAISERDRVLDEVVAKMQARGSYSPGMQVIATWARSGREFSLNRIRDELTAAGVTGQFAPGGLMQRAARLGLIVKVRDEVSTLPSTNGKTIAVYRGAGQAVAHEAVTVPVQRDRTGKFTQHGSACDTPALFDVQAAS